MDTTCHGAHEHYLFRQCIPVRQTLRQIKQISAINLGVKPPTASLGSLITDAQENLQYYPYQVMIPAIALVLISLAFILLGDGLRDALDPKSSAE